MLEKYFPEDWIAAMGAEELTEVLTTISNELVVLRETQEILPEAGSPLLFQAFRETPYSAVRVIVVGQDPFHDRSFNGLAFGNGSPDEFQTKKISPSLRNILKEVERSEGLAPNPNLYSWARQGVLLINTAHSVVAGYAGSHLELWKPFTDLVIKAINKKPYVVWMLWGSKAQAYEVETNSFHNVLIAGHPSPLNNTHPFSGCNCFQECNKLLKKRGQELIIWN